MHVNNPLLSSTHCTNKPKKDLAASLNQVFGMSLEKQNGMFPRQHYPACTWPFAFASPIFPFLSSSSFSLTSLPSSLPPPFLPDLISSLPPSFFLPSSFPPSLFLLSSPPLFSCPSLFSFLK